MEQMKIYWEKYRYYVIVASVLILGVGLFLMRGATMHTTTTTTEPKVEQVIETRQSSEKKKVYVDVKGAVKNPGVYAVDDNTRVKNIVDLAGGLREDADATSINMAQSVYDEMVIVIPRANENLDTIKTDHVSAKVNLNTATKEQLMTLKGVGDSKAEAILAYRKEKGRFTTVDDLAKVKGFSKSSVDAIRLDVIVR